MLNLRKLCGKFLLMLLRKFEGFSVWLMMLLLRVLMLMV